MRDPLPDARFPRRLQDPDVVLLRSDAESAEYWKAPGALDVALLPSYVKAKATGAPLRGESGMIRSRRSRAADPVVEEAR